MTGFLLRRALGAAVTLLAVFLSDVTARRYLRNRDLALLCAAALLENVGYRQLNSFWRLEGLVRWLLGRKPGWGQMTRTAAWQAEELVSDDVAKL